MLRVLSKSYTITHVPLMLQATPCDDESNVGGGFEGFPENQALVVFPFTLFVRLLGECLLRETVQVDCLSP